MTLAPPKTPLKRFLSYLPAQVLTLLRMGWSKSSAARRKRHWLRANPCPIGRQATGATEGNHSQALSRGRSLGSAGSGSKEIGKKPGRQELGLQLHSLRVNSADELEGGFKIRSRHVAMLLLDGGVLSRRFKSKRLTWQQEPTTGDLQRQGLL